MTIDTILVILLGWTVAGLFAAMAFGTVVRKMTSRHPHGKAPDALTGQLPKPAANTHLGVLKKRSKAIAGLP